MEAIQESNKRILYGQKNNIRDRVTPGPLVIPIFNDDFKLTERSREGLFWSSVPKGVKCHICPNECVIREGKAGLCHNRINYDGRLYSIAYGNPCAINIDPIEKKPLNHFCPGIKAFSVAAAGCNLSCKNCQNWNISQTSPRETENYELMPEKLIENAIAGKCKSIAYTYTEPVTSYEYTIDSARLAQKHGLKNVLVTAGFINQVPLRHLCQYIDAANVDLKSFSNEIYLKLSSGTLEPVLRTLKTMAEMNVWLEITNLIIPGWTDDPAMIRKMCNWLVDNGLAGSPLHFSRFHPANKLLHLLATPIESLLKAKEIALSEGIKYVYIGNVQGIEDANTFCPKCKVLLIKRIGFSVVQNKLVKGCCSNCSEKIEGVWE